MTGSARFLALRLLPGDDLLASLAACVAHNGIQAGWIAAEVGFVRALDLPISASLDAFDRHWQERFARRTTAPNSGARSFASRPSTND